jgi:hypothetical protein
LVYVRPDHTVIFDAGAVQDLLIAVKSKEERKALIAAIAKLQALGEQLAPPHMKPLGGRQAVGLRELRPRQGNSDWRAVYARIGRGAYVVLALGTHRKFDDAIARAQVRFQRYGESLDVDA